MLELRNVSKIFKSGNNKIRAIDNTTISFQNSGLVALLGPSGCGKTTLLNVIGGLDKTNKGDIFLDGIKYTSISKIDELRNLNIGYIFQDYKLVNNLSVYENVAITLRMIGVKNEEEIKLRTLEVLELVSMSRYKKRPASMLSGGEKQRVAIARALVKIPNIILADEPTGNLDSKNSLEIMKIIKAISKTRLVILVTHEKKLAKFYADRIIEIKDGNIINDYLNNHNESLEYEIENNIYLKDFKNISEYKNDLYDINLYNDNSNIKLDIVVKNNNIYIRSNQKVSVIDEDSRIELINAHYKDLDKNEIDEFKFDMTVITKDKKYSSIFNFFSIFKNGFRKVFKYSLVKKILLFGFFLSAMFVMFSLSSLYGIFISDDEEFINHDRDYVIATMNNSSYEEYLEISKLEDVSYIIFDTSLIDIAFKYDVFEQIKHSISFKASLTDSEATNLIYGTFAKENEVVIDKLVLERELLETLEYQMMGITEISQFLGKTVVINNQEYVISGITDNLNPSIYVADINNFIEIKDGSLYNYESSNLDLVLGDYPSNYEVLVHVDSGYLIGSNVSINDTLYKVSGFYTGIENNFYTNLNTMREITIADTEELFIKTDNMDSVISALNNMGINAISSYEQSKNEYQQEVISFNTIIIAISLVILSISLIEILLIIRSSFLSRVKEVGIYRAIGVKKMDIYKMFIGEIIAITTLASLPGVILMAYILNSISALQYMFEINLISVSVTIMFIYIFNIIVGLIPVFATIIKPPAYILSRSDVE